MRNDKKMIQKIVFCFQKDKHDVMSLCESIFIALQMYKHFFVKINWIFFFYRKTWKKNVQQVKAKWQYVKISLIQSSFDVEKSIWKSVE